MKKSTLVKLSAGIIGGALLTAGLIGTYNPYVNEYEDEHAYHVFTGEDCFEAVEEAEVENAKNEEVAKAFAEKIAKMDSQNASSSITGLTEVGTDGSVAGKSSDFKGLNYADFISAESEQGKIIALSVTDENGICKINDMILVSLDKSYGAEIGQVVELTIGNRLVKAVVADFKESDGAIVNFICREDETPDRVKSFGSFSVLEEYAGEITSVELQ